MIFIHQSVKHDLPPETISTNYTHTHETHARTQQIRARSRRRFGSKLLDQSLYGGGGGEGGDDSEGEGITDIGFGEDSGGGRGLGALIASAIGPIAGGEGGGGGRRESGEGGAESRPLLGRGQSSARVRVRNNK